MKIPFTDLMVKNFAREKFPANAVCFSYGDSRFYINEVSTYSVHYGVNNYSLSSTGYVILGVRHHRRILGNRCIVEIDDEDNS